LKICGKKKTQFVRKSLPPPDKGGEGGWAGDRIQNTGKRVPPLIKGGRGDLSKSPLDKGREKEMMKILDKNN